MTRSSLVDSKTSLPAGPRRSEEVGLELWELDTYLADEGDKNQIMTNSMFAFIVYDVTNSTSFESVLQVV